MLELGLKTLLAYLTGSLIGALVVGGLRGGVDIRKLGSGNAGGTNALRTQGLAFAIWVMFIDVGKGIFAVTILAQFDVTSLLPTSELFLAPYSSMWLQVSCACAVVLGHVFPVWFEFRGGKGAATLLGVLGGLLPGAIPAVMLIWLTVLAISGFVGLATIIATASFPLLLMWFHDSVPVLLPLFVFGAFVVPFVCYTHRSNIARMMSGSEPRSQRMWLLRPRG